jgi:tetratricopeptide (TPR) repeat protein
MKTFKYRWKINGREIIGIKDCQSKEALQEHVGSVGGELLEIVSEADKPVPLPAGELKQDVVPQKAIEEAKPAPETAQAGVLKLYSLGSIIAATFFFGPLAGFYLVSRNLKNLGRRARARNNLATGSVLTVFLCAGIAFIPEGMLRGIHLLVFLVLCVLTACFYLAQIQGRDLDAHFKSGAKKYSGWRVLGTGLAALVISFVILFVFSGIEVFVNQLHAQREADKAIEFGRTGKFPEAVSAFDKALRLSPYDARLYLNRGSAYAGLGNYDLAIADFTRCIELDPRDLSAYDLRAAAYAAIRNYDGVIADCTRAIALNPDDAAAFENRARAHQHKKNIDQALADFTSAITINPRNAESYHNRAAIYYGRGDYDRAISDCTKILELNSRDVDAYILRGTAYAGKGNYDQALFDASRAIEFDPANAQAYGLRGNAAASKGAFDQAIADYSKAVELAPDEAVTYRNRAVAYFQKADYDKAWLDVQKIVSLKGIVDAEFMEELKKASGREK